MAAVNHGQALLASGRVTTWVFINKAMSHIQNTHVFLKPLPMALVVDNIYYLWLVNKNKEMLSTFNSNILTKII